ncbi:MAG: BON domain-containing protein [Candidatus Limnocylindria bacterium]|nr:BON domain-containing protein [Candidatus Limnocylindria bacterium]
MTLTKTRPKTDKQIQLDVLAEIARDFRFKPAEVGVEVDAGVVTLTGTVTSYPKLALAAEIASDVPAVKDVANKLIVEIAPYAVRDDTRIAQAVRNALEWNVTVPEERIDSVVRNGVVLLKGTVDYWYERQAATDTVRNLLGVVSVNNHIVIAPAARADEAIQDEVKSACMRRFPLHEIDVIVDRGIATLTGKVLSYRTRREAEGIAWSTPGVKTVTNNIELTF